jgi:hypothetical protein
MIRNKKFNKILPALKYSKQHGLKIIAVDTKYFNKETNKIAYCYNYLCLNKQDYYKFIKKKIECIEAVNMFDNTEKTSNNFNFEVLTNNKRKIHMDIDKTPKRDIIKAINLLKSKVKEFLDIDVEPLIFIRENYFKPDNDDDLCSVHIIYNNFSMDFLQQGQLIQFIQVSFLELDMNIDTSIYTKNRVFNLPHNTKQQYKILIFLYRLTHTQMSYIILILKMF